MYSESQNSLLAGWLRKRGMKTQRLVELIGCSRTIIWKVKRGIPICPLYGNRIIRLTEGEIIPEIEAVGRKFINK